MTIDKSLLNYRPKRELADVTRFIAEFGFIGVKEARACLFAGLFFVVMYATEWCGYCTQAREYFTANGIPYVEYDIEKSSKAKRNFDVLKGSGTPLIYQGYTRVSGFHPRLVEDKFEL